VRTGCDACRYTLVATAVALALPAYAAHPLLTEDTGTQGAGKFELEIGFADAKDGGARASELGPQLSYGAADTLDLILRPAWLWIRGDATAGATQGFGDVGLDFKWRFRESGPLSFGLRAGADLPTGSDDKGLGRGRVSPHAILIAAYGDEPWLLAANLAYVYDPLVGDRRHLWGASGAAVWSATDAWRFSAEVGTVQNTIPERASWLTVARLGAIAAVTRGLDVDAGYQLRLSRAVPVRILLAGATLHW
jgi:hypothetical protein